MMWPNHLMIWDGKQGVTRELESSKNCSAKHRLLEAGMWLYDSLSLFRFQDGAPNSR
jgi:hypothetical protein